MTYVARNAILSIKYAYYNDDELEGVRKAAPIWTDAHQARKLIGRGWRFPLEHEDLVEDEIKIAQALCDVHLTSASFKVDDPEVRACVRIGLAHVLEVPPRQPLLRPAAAAQCARVARG